MSCDTKTRFDNENFQTLARLAVTKFLQFRPRSECHGARDNGDEEIGREDIIDFDEDIPDINREIWNEETTRVLDFACGPALISQNVVPYVKQVVGVDISQEFVDIYNARVHNQGLARDEMRAECMDILDGGGHDLGVFDNAVCSMAYHHIHDIDAVTKRVAALLKPGGWYFVLDHEGGGKHHIRAAAAAKHSEHAGVHHHGVSEDAMVAAFQKAGFGKIHVEKAFRIRMWFTEDRLMPWADPKEKHLLQSKVDSDGKTVYKVPRHLMIVCGQKSLE